MSLVQLESQWMYSTEDFVNEVKISPDDSYIGAIGTSNGERVYVFNRNGSLLWEREGMSFLSFSNNNYVAVGGKGIALLTGDGDVLGVQQLKQVIYAFLIGGECSVVSGFKSDLVLFF